MPYKICPQCNVKVGVRTKLCKCGYNFNRDFNQAIFGCWAYDRPKNLPKIERPTRIPNGKLSIEEIKEWIAYEGIGECVIGYFPASKIEDKILAKMWEKARKALQDILLYIYENKQ